MTWSDSIVDEVHRLRQELWEAYGGVDGYLKHLEEWERKHSEEIVDRSSMVESPDGVHEIQNTVR